ncbi:GNAT family N-acetyltransferase [Nocardioides sp. zg-DK7169]|uniref:GNAT family N-acetyltransferase n=1 Tax=Nocardioides sp. zg-DK7169 TaxID=2736600 RepID=UPI0015532EE0|nr:GNAT family protein [Nocardioides sp. zg-DK7169]NPC97225.1 GNAT family N-acetyltransferase [Nocardioides sp. zg-DK7169]
MSGPLDSVAWPVRTERLVLRPATPGDVEATYRIRVLPEVSRWITAAPGDPASYAASFAEPDRLARTLVVELGSDGGPVIGDLMLWVGDAWAQVEVAEAARACQAELGWVLDPAYAGRGFATEAVRALLGTCFDALGLRRVVAECFADNTASWRLMERVGMRREAHTVRESLHRDLGWLDGFSYALLAEEWAARER